jgi:hypothetical protein
MIFKQRLCLARVIESPVEAEQYSTIHGIAEFMALKTQCFEAL